MSENARAVCEALGIDRIQCVVFEPSERVFVVVLISIAALTWFVIAAVIGTVVAAAKCLWDRRADLLPTRSGK